MAPAWRPLIVPQTETASSAGAAPEHGVASQERLKREFVVLMQALARQRPLVLFLDDLHWADVSTVDALAYAAPRLAGHRILTIGTFRPAELLSANETFCRVKLELQGHGACHEIAMPLLTTLDLDRYLALQFRGHRFPAALAWWLHSRTEGNPLFMADLVRFLRDRGVLAQREAQWTMVGQLSDVERELPESVRSMVEKKIGELTDHDRHLMSAAAVLGPQFDSAIVARALAMNTADVEERFGALDRMCGLVQVIGERVLADSTLSLECGFVHVLYQNALYDALTPARRVALSRQLGEVLADVHAKAPEGVASRLALLFETARDFARASDFFLLASQNAARMCAVEQAIALARQSMINAEQLEGDERHRRVMAAAMYSAWQHQSVTRLDAALADLQLAERSAASLDDPIGQVNAIFGQAMMFFLAKCIPQIQACGTRATQVAQQSPSAGVAAASTLIVAIAGFCAGDVATAEQQFDEVIPVLRQCGFPFHAMVAVLLRGVLHTWRLEHQEAERALTLARATARELHASFEMLVGLWHETRTLGNQGRLGEAHDMLDESMRLADLLDDRFMRPRIENTRAWILAELFDTETSLQLNAGAVRMACEFGDVEAECNSHINAARDYLTVGEPHNALLHLRQAEAR